MPTSSEKKLILPGEELRMLVQSDDLGGVEKLFKDNPYLDLNATDIDGNTALILVASMKKENSIKIAQFLIKNGADVELVNHSKKNAWDLSIESYPNNEMSNLIQEAELDALSAKKAISRSNSISNISDISGDSTEVPFYRSPSSDSLDTVNDIKERMTNMLKPAVVSSKLKIPTPPPLPGAVINEPVLTREQADQINKMRKSGVPEGAIKQRLASWGIKPEAVKVEKVVIPLREEDYSKPLNDIRSTLNSYTPEYIVDNKLVIKAAEHNNPIIAFHLAKRVIDSKMPDDIKKEALIEGTIALVEHAKEISDIENNKKADLLNKKEEVRLKFERIRQTSFDSPDLKDAIKQIIVDEGVVPVKHTTPAKQEKLRLIKEEEHRQAAIKLVYPNIEEQEAQEYIAVEDEIKVQEKETSDNISSLKNSITRSVASGLVVSSELKASLKEVPSGPAKNLVVDAIRGGSLQLESKSNRQIIKPKKISLMEDNPPELSSESKKLISDFQETAESYRKSKQIQDTDEKKLKDLHDLQQAQSDDMIDGIFADLVPQAIKLKQLNKALVEHGHVCADVDRYVEASLSHHITAGLSLKDFSDQEKTNVSILTKGKRSEFKEEVNDPINQSAVSIVVPNDLESIKAEMTSILASMGIRRDAVEITTQAQHEAKEAASSLEKSGVKQGQTSLMESALRQGANKIRRDISGGRS